MTLAGAGARCAAAAFSCALGAGAASAGDGGAAAPFRTLNLSPTVSIFGLPAWETAPEGSRIVVTTGLGNDFRFSSEGGDVLILDGETWRTSLAFGHRFKHGWTAGIEVPYYRVSGGVLDDVIDGWHSFFGMPDGGRNGRPQDQVLFILGGESGGFFGIDGGGSGLGDAQVSAGHVFGTADAQLYLKATLKLPTGDEDILAGSGSRDWAVTLLRSRRVSFRARPAGLYWGLGVAGLGDARRLGYAQEPRTYLALVGGGMKPWPRTGIKVQVDLHSKLYDSELKELGGTAVEASLGGWRDVGPGRSLEFAVIEDLNVGTAPDVALHVAFEWAW